MFGDDLEAVIAGRANRDKRVVHGVTQCGAIGGILATAYIDTDEGHGGIRWVGIQAMIRHT